MISIKRDSVIIIAKSWPCEDYGGSIAVTSSLRQYENYFSNITYICICDTPIGSQALQAFPRVKFHPIRIKRRSFIFRFLLACLENRAAVSVGMAGRGVYSQIRVIIQSLLPSASCCCAGIIEDNVPSVHLARLKQDFPNMIWAYRSHDLLHQAFSVFKSRGSLLMRVAWAREVAKIFEFERAAALNADLRWTITEEDRQQSDLSYGLMTDGVFDVDIDAPKYSEVGVGDPIQLLHLGSADKRKSHGIRMFIEHAWPVIREVEPRLKFILGGRGTECFHRPDANIEGIGRVSDELEFLSRGMMFLNPQEAGTGLKLKSLVAMAAGKVLITTKNGALGLGGTPGEHYILADTPVEMVDAICELSKNLDRARCIARSGQIYVEENFSESALSERIAPLLANFLSEIDNHESN